MIPKNPPPLVPLITQRGVRSPLRTVQLQPPVLSVASRANPTSREPLAIYKRQLNVTQSTSQLTEPPPLIPLRPVAIKGTTAALPATPLSSWKAPTFEETSTSRWVPVHPIASLKLLHFTLTTASTNQEPLKPADPSGNHHDKEVSQLSFVCSPPPPPRLGPKSRLSRVLPRPGPRRRPCSQPG